MSELKPCKRDLFEAMTELEDMAYHSSKKKSISGKTLAIAISAIQESANRRAQPANEPLTQPEDQWMETASDNTDCVLAYADGIYCMTDADGHVICEFIRKPEPEGSKE